MFHCRQSFKDTWMTSIESFQFIIIKIKNFNSAVSCTFGLSYKVVGLYLEILIAPINSVHMGILWTKFHKKNWKSLFLTTKLQNNVQKDWALAKHNSKEFYDWWKQYSISSFQTIYFISMIVFCMCGILLCVICI